MTVGFVLGNGRSRLSIDLLNLKSRGRTYGCNRIYQEFEPDVLIATDRNMSAEIEDAKYALTHEFWTRRPQQDKGGRQLEKPYYGMSSGPNALARACADGCEQIYLIGFDFGSPTEFVNNVYAGSPHYKGRTEKSTYYDNWVRQIIMVADKFSNNMFYRVMGQESTDIDFSRPFIQTINIDSFKTVINNT